MQRRWMMVFGGLQGLSLWALHEHWPDTTPWLALAMGALYFVLAGGLVVHMARTGRDTRRLLASAVSVGVAFGAVACWVGWQQPGPDAVHDGDDLRMMTWALGAAVALFVLGPFVQIHQRTGRLRFPYAELYRHSWNDFFVASLAMLYLWAVWAVLLLWGQLFELIGIGLFEDVFTEEVFVFGTTGAALGYGLAAARENERVIGALRGVTQALLRAMLPVLCGVTLAFLAALPFTGLEGLFGSTSAATVLLWWLVAGVVLLNAVFLDGSRPPPYAAFTRRVVEAGVLATPALAGLCLYALLLRVGQHGLTPPRMYALLLASVLSLYALGYAAAVVRGSDVWLGPVRRVNVIVAGVWIALAFAVHTPLLDPLRWSLASQLARLEDGRVAPSDFDFAYLRFHLGWRGAEALERLAREHRDPEVRERIALARSLESYWRWEQQQPAGEALELERVPPGHPWPPGLRAAIGSVGTRDFLRGLCGPEGRGRCIVTPRDLDGDGAAEELLFAASTGTVNVHVFARRPESGWVRIGALIDPELGHGSLPLTPTLLEAVRDGRTQLLEPRYRDLEIEGRRLSLDPW